MAANTKPKETQEPDVTVLASGTDLPAQKLSTEGLKDADEIEVTHPDTGQTYGMTVKAFHDLYEPLGYRPVRMGNGLLLPGDKRAPASESVPANAPAPVMPPGDTGE